MPTADPHIAQTLPLQRVSPVALLYFFGRTLSKLARQLSNLLPLIVILFATSADTRGLILIALATLLPAGLIIFTLLDWWCFRYAIAQGRLEVRQGVLRRKQLTLEFARIQQADVREPWYFRPFGLAVLGVESAGSDTQEVELAGLQQAHAYTYKEAILLESVDTTSTPATYTTNPSHSTTATTLFELPLREVARYGLIHNPILLLFPILLYPLSQVDRVDDLILPYLESAIESIEHYQQTEFLWVGISALVLLVLGVVVGLSVLIAIVRFYGYRLDTHASRYHARMGWLNKTSRSFQYVRLQRVVITQGLIAGLLRRVSMRINQTGQGKAQALDRIFFIPILTTQRLELLQHELKLETPTWQRVHWASMLMPWVFTTCGLTVAAAVVSQYSTSVTLHTLWISALLSGAIQGLSWRKRGVYMGARWFATRHGVVGQQQRFIPNNKVQAIKLTQGPWLRWWGMAKLKVYSAAGRETVAWLPYSQLKTLQQELLQRTTEFQGRWM